MKSYKIKIGKKNYDIKFKLRAQLLFEQVFNKPLSLTTTIDILGYLWCLLESNNTDLDIEFLTNTDKDILTIIDENPDVLNQFYDILKKDAEYRGLTSKEENKETKEDKDEDNDSPKK